MVCGARRVLRLHVYNKESFSGLRCATRAVSSHVQKRERMRVSVAPRLVDLKVPVWLARPFAPCYGPGEQPGRTQVLGFR